MKDYMNFSEENRDLILFDLLEGNLSEQERNELLQFIETDEVWKKEWALLQQCVLEPEMEIVFENKKTLLKPVAQTKIIGINRSWAIWSAAASLIFLAWFYWNSEKESPLISSNDKPKHNVQNYHKYNPKSTEIDLHSDKKELVKTANEVKMPVAPIIEILNPIDSQTVVVEIIAKTGNIPVEIEHSTKFLPEDLSTMVLTTPDEGNEDKPQKQKEFKGLRYAINQEIDKITNPYRNPRVSFKRGVKDNNPMVMVHLTTNAYEANASFQLKTNR